MLRVEWVMAEFGQTEFGQTDFGQAFVLTDFGQTDFGQTVFGQLVMPRFSWISLVCSCWCVGALVWCVCAGGVCVGGSDSCRPLRRALRQTALRRTAQNFALFFFPLPPHCSFFLPSLGGPFVEFWWCFLKASTLKCARLEFSGCRVKPRQMETMSSQ